MATNGLGKSDIEDKSIIGGLFKEFTSKVYSYYKNKYEEGSIDLALCRQGYYYEPKVANKVFWDMLQAEPLIQVLTDTHLNMILRENHRIVGVELSIGSKNELRVYYSKILVDSSYEGDLLAMAGARYRLGREGRKEFNEPHAGVIYYNYQDGIILPDSTHEEDDSVQAYTYRFCLSKKKENQYRLVSPPQNYDRKLYLPYFDDLKHGRLSAPKVFHEGWGYYPEHFDTLLRALSVTDLSNGMVDANINPRPLAFPFAELNRGYITGTRATRDHLAERHKEVALGLLWFLQNEKEISPEQRYMANQYHLPLDEFENNNHFPYQLYIREGRRLVGEYTLTEHDVAVTPDVPGFYHHQDTIAMGEFPIDSFPVTKRISADRTVLEGYLGMLAHLTRPYEIPYRCLIPEQVDGIIVSVAISATHVGFSSIRMEPTWMAIGQAAGVAAHVSIQDHVNPRAVDVKKVRDILMSQGQILQSPNQK
jgi:hypothetical protein